MTERQALIDNAYLHNNAWRRSHFHLVKPNKSEITTVSEIKNESKREEFILGFLNSHILKEPISDLDTEAQNLICLFNLWKRGNPADPIRRTVNFKDLETAAKGQLLSAQSNKLNATDSLEFSLADKILTYYFRVTRIVKTARKLEHFQTASSY